MGASKSKSTKKPATSTQSVVEVLPAALDASNIESIYKIFLSLSKKKTKEVTLDASAVERLTTPAVQLLLSLAKTLHNTDMQFSILQPSVVFDEVFDDMGLSVELEDWRKE
jgi:anti-anti-sigma regulatory factor